MVEIKVPDRLTKEEWADKKCSICGETACIRVLHVLTDELEFRCLEHMPTPMELIRAHMNPKTAKNKDENNPKHSKEARQ